MYTKKSGPKKDNKIPQAPPQKNKNSELIRELREEAKFVKQKLDDISKNGIKGEFCYLMSIQTLKSWKEHVDFENILKENKQPDIKLTKKPEKINEDLIVTDKDYLQFPDKDSICAAICKPDLAQEKDYICIDQELWDHFEKKYGGTPIKRRFIIENGKIVLQNDTEIITLIFVYASFLQMLENNKVDQLKIKKLQIPRDMTMKELKSLLAKIINRLKIFKYNIDSGSTRIWKMDPAFETIDALKNHLYKSCTTSKTYDYQITYNGELCDRVHQRSITEVFQNDYAQPLVIEINEPGKLWIFYNDLVKACKKCDFCGRIDFVDFSCSCKKVAYCSESCKYRDKAEHSKKCDLAYDSDDNKEIEKKANPARGLCGLENLGNTCYMNSALQCLSNIPELTEYFLSLRYKDDINEENPLGSQGKIARKFAFLLKKLWLDNEKYFAPHSFKFAMSKYQTMFHGHNQHDPNEFLFYLLDALHEDLNLVKKKPFIEMPDLDNKSDLEIAKTSWDIFLKRNQSKLVDCMFGQYKSTITCMECKTTSKNFETYSICSIPIPYQKEIEVFFVHSNYEKKPYRILLKYPNENHLLSDLKADIARLLDKNINSIVLAIGGTGNISIITNLSSPTAETIKKLDKAYLLACEIDEQQLKITESKRKFVGLKTVKRDKNGNITKLGIARLICLDHNMTNKEIHHYLFSKFRFIFDNSWPFKITPPYHSLSTEKALHELSRKYPQPYILTLTVQGDTTKDTFIPFDDDQLLSRFSTTSEVMIGLEWSNLPDVFEFDIFKNYLNYDPYKQNKDQKNVEKNFVDITDCLESFREPEELKDNDAWYCKNCKKHQPALKKLEIYSSPLIFIIHLKRFKGPDNTRWNRTESKITDMVTFPIENFNLTPFLCNKLLPNQYFNGQVEEEKNDQPAVYDLFGVVHHSGNLNSGHCISHCKHPETGEWYRYDDEKVQKVTNLDEIITDTAYILFYRKRV